MRGDLTLSEVSSRLGNSRRSALVAEHPHRERLVRLRMLALHRVGRTAEALAAYSELASPHDGVDRAKALLASLPA